MAVRVKGGGDAMRCERKSSPRGNGEAGHHVNESPRVWPHYGPSPIEFPVACQLVFLAIFPPIEFMTLSCLSGHQICDSRAGPSRREPPKRRPLSPYL